MEELGLIVVWELVWQFLQSFAEWKTRGETGRGYLDTASDKTYP